MVDSELDSSFLMMSEFFEMGVRVCNLTELVAGLADPGAAESKSNSDEMEILKNSYRDAMARAEKFEVRCLEQESIIQELEHKIGTLIKTKFHRLVRSTF